MSAIPLLPVVVMAKAPVAGRVKTRLVPVLGAEGAARLARALLEDGLQTLTRLPWAKLRIAADEPEAFTDFGLPVEDQGTGPLGERLERVLQRALRDGPAALAVGTDAPGLPLELLERARSALDRADAVFVPADDGGFVALGLRRCPPGLLADLPWSCEGTLEATEARLRKHGFRVARTRGWFDIDGPADLARLRVERALGGVRSPAVELLLDHSPHAPWLSVVMPVLDEESRLPEALRRLGKVAGVDEILVVDGGSRDRSRAIAESEGARVVVAPKGRGPQMNAGAAVARGEALCFLHADVSLPPDAVRQIARALSRPSVVATAFRTLTVDDGGDSRWRPWLRVADLRSHAARLPYGDQAVCVRRSVFERIEGFPVQPLFEDVEMARRLQRVGRIARLPGYVQVSGRRFVQRPFRTVALWNVLPTLYRLGLPPSLLERLYGRVR